MTDIDALEVVGLSGLAKTALIDTTSNVCVAKLTIDRLDEAELAPVVHLHRIFLRTVHHGVLR